MDEGEGEAEGGGQGDEDVGNGSAAAGAAAGTPAGGKGRKGATKGRGHQNAAMEVEDRQERPQHRFRSVYGGMMYCGINSSCLKIRRVGAFFVVFFFQCGL